MIGIARQPSDGRPQHPECPGNQHGRQQVPAAFPALCPRRASDCAAPRAQRSSARLSAAPDRPCHPLPPGAVLGQPPPPAPERHCRLHGSSRRQPPLLGASAADPASPAAPYKHRRPPRRFPWTRHLASVPRSPSTSGTGVRQRTATESATASFLPGVPNCSRQPAPATSQNQRAVACALRS